MLHIYSRYCRYFLDDLKMKEIYEAEIQKFGPSIVTWKNPFDFELSQENDSESSDEEDDNKDLWFFKSG